MDIEEKCDILLDLFDVYLENQKSFKKCSQYFNDLQVAFAAEWARGYQGKNKVMTYSNFVNSLRRGIHNHLWMIDYPENLINLCSLERNLRTIILKITGFLPGYENNKEEKFEPTTTNSDFESNPSFIDTTQN